MTKDHQGESEIKVCTCYCLVTTKTRFSKVDLTQFRVRDIVEVQITVIAVPIWNSKYKMITQLRSLALLDGSFTDVSI